MIQNLIIILTSLILVGFTSPSKAQETLLNCKWQSGVFGKEKIIRGEKLSEDLIVGLNISQKKVTKPLGVSPKATQWDDNSIKWIWVDKDITVTTSHTLSRISGSYIVEINHLESKIITRLFYQCDKAQKKF
jgi:hypothetical protein